MIGTQTTTSRVIEGLIPAGVFLPVPKAVWGGATHGSLEGSSVLWEAVYNYLGMSRFRLHVALGGFPTNAYGTARKYRLSQLFLTRLAYLLYLKGAKHLNTSAIQMIDWNKGWIYLNEGENITFDNIERELVRE